MEELKPRVVAAIENYDYDTRLAALRLIGCGEQIGSAINDVLAHAKRGEVLRCLAAMSFAGFLEYYRGDSELAGWTCERELVMARELANIETELFQTHERATILKRILADDGPPQPTLPRPVETEFADNMSPRPQLPARCRGEFARRPTATGYGAVPSCCGHPARAGTRRVVKVVGGAMVLGIRCQRAG